MKEKKLSYSKVGTFILASIFTILSIAESIFSMWHTYKTQDATVLCYSIPATSTMMVAIWGLYSWKAKAENIIKIKKNYGEDFIEKTGIEHL